MKIAVVGIQGDVIEHISFLKQTFNKLAISGEVIWVRSKEDLRDIEGITIPGGESTTIGKLLSDSEMEEAIKSLANNGMQILGTCAGAILLAKYGLINIKVDRNAYGRQKDSFEAEISTSLGNFRGIFIRAPLIKEVLEGAEIFAKNGDEIVGAEQDNILALTFHPELSGDTRIFEYFIKKIKERKNQ